MDGGIILLFFAMVGALAVPIAAIELLLREIRRRRDRAIVRERLLDERGAPEVPCPWPQLEPEVQRLRERGAL